VVALSLAAALLAAACASTADPGAAPTSAPLSASPSSSASPSPSTTPSASPSKTPSNTPPGPSAADQLAGFLAAAGRMDVQIRTAAALINTGIGPQSIRLTGATVEAVKAIDPQALARTIPGAMPARLQQQVLLLFSDLASRRYSFNEVLLYQDGQPIARTTDVGKHLVDTLGYGAPAAARYPGDLAATRTLAASLPPLAVAAPDSRASAAVAVQTTYIMEANSGCGSAGGWIETKPVPLVWKQGTDFSGQRTDGTIAGILFWADYRPGLGWQVTIEAC
jgi:hypothetical protein